MDHLAKAQAAAVVAREHHAVAELARPATQRAIMHALIDIAESLRKMTPAPPIGNTIVRCFGGAHLHLAGLADLPLESVGVADDDEDGAK